MEHKTPEKLFKLKRFDSIKPKVETVNKEYTETLSKEVIDDSVF